MRVQNPYSKKEFKDDGTHIGLKSVPMRSKTADKQPRADSPKAPSEKKIQAPTAEKKAEIPVATEKKHNENGRVGDDSAKVVEKLTEKQRRIFDEMPLDRAVTVDYLTKTGFTLGEVISTLTVLEIKGLVSSLPGALYIRR